jgi:hypothetical protein
VEDLFAAVVASAANCHIIPLILVMLSRNSHRMTLTVTECEVIGKGECLGREEGVEWRRMLAPSSLSCRLQDLRELHTLLPWLKSKGFCLFEGKISLAPCWSSLMSRATPAGTPAVQKVVELFTLLRRRNYRPALLSVRDQHLDCDDKIFCAIELPFF